MRTPAQAAYNERHPVLALRLDQQTASSLRELAARLGLRPGPLARALLRGQLSGAAEAYRTGFRRGVAATLMVLATNAARLGPYLPQLDHHEVIRAFLQRLAEMGLDGSDGCQT